MRRAKQQTISFEALDSSSGTGALLSGLTLLTSDVAISKDGGAFAAATNAPAEIGSSGCYSLVLTATETNCGWLLVKITKAGMRPRIVGGQMDSQQTATVAGSGQTAASFVTNLTETIDGVHVGKLARFQTGLLAGQVRKITGYNGATKALSFTDAFSAAPSAADVLTLIDD